ncbi:NDR1/HIN1-like protein 3 [Argentina anserina]|uniref:NDR1/HIN1-like protein 3 n=1 Tax=Argentina anserina TaxID=57926 RepID=UPI00217661B9|nr:NDR1/HIN1-like protein 3 [Potentilla anserina]
MSVKKTVTIIGIVCAVIVVIGGLVSWTTVPPNKPRITVINGSLTQFYLNNNTLYYNLALNIAFKNPSITKPINYKHIETTARYIDERFPLETFTSSPFKQGAKDTNVLSLNFQGQQIVKFSEDVLSQFQSETVAGAYTINVAVVLQILKFSYKPHTLCLLKVPLRFNSTSTSGSFRVTQCSVQKN